MTDIDEMIRELRDPVQMREGMYAAAADALAALREERDTVADLLKGLAAERVGLLSERDRLKSLLCDAVELFEMGDEASAPGTDAYTWLTTARAALAATGEEEKP